MPEVLGKLIETNEFETYKSVGVTPYLNDFTGKKLTTTIANGKATFTDDSITSTAVIEGPFVADVLVGIDSIDISGTTIEYTFADQSGSANGKSCVIWVRTLSS